MPQIPSEPDVDGVAPTIAVGPGPVPPPPPPPPGAVSVYEAETFEVDVEAVPSGAAAEEVGDGDDTREIETGTAPEPGSGTGPEPDSVADDGAEPEAAGPEDAEPQAAGPGNADAQAAEPQAPEPGAAEPRAADAQDAEPRGPEPRAAEAQAAEPQGPEPEDAEPRSQPGVEAHPQPEVEGEPASGVVPEAAPEVEVPAGPAALETPVAPAVLPMRPVRRIPASGERFGRYTLGESLGHGGFAHVYRAEDDAGEQVAIKVLTGLPDDARQRFAQEAELLERLEGRGFPRYIAADLSAPQPWFAMELVPGSTLLERVRAEGPLSGQEGLRLVAQVVDALLVLQEQRCLHRDLKPANIMVDGDRAVLIDLGIAKVFDAATSTQPAGTVSYMAPELFGRRVHPRSDVYSLGLLLVFALAGALPPDLNFLGRDLLAGDLVEPEPGTEPPPLDKHLLPLILAMTRYQPAHRPPLENIARVVAARLGSQEADPTLLLTERLVADGVTKAEQAVLPATEVLSLDPTKVFDRSAGASADGTTPVRFREPWHGLVYDRELMRVLSEVHADGFDGAAPQVIADHVGQLGVDAAEGHTPAEIKDWIWRAMRWEPAAPPDGHADTLRGWQSFRKPEPVAAPAHGPAQDPTQVQSAVQDPTQVQARPAPPSIAPRPNSMRSPGATVARSTSVRRLGPVPRSRSVEHLGPTPRPPSVRPRPPAGAAPAPGADPRSTQRVARQPAPAPQQGHPTAVQPPAQGPARPYAAQQGGPQAPQPYPQPSYPQQGTSRTRPAQPRAPRPAQPQQPGYPPPGARPATPGNPSKPRRNLGRRFFGALLRWVPRLILLGAWALVVGAVPGSPFPLDPTPMTPWITYATDLPLRFARFGEGPLVAAAALVVAMLLRAAGHRMHRWFYFLNLFLVLAAAAALGGAAM